MVRIWDMRNYGKYGKYGLLLLYYIFLINNSILVSMILTHEIQSENLTFSGHVRRLGARCEKERDQPVACHDHRRQIAPRKIGIYPAQMRTMVLEYLPTFTAKNGPNVGKYSIHGASGLIYTKKWWFTNKNNTLTDQSGMTWRIMNNGEPTIEKGG